jgi:hypothetical protein
MKLHPKGKTMTAQTPNTLPQAFGACVSSACALLITWKAGQSAERLRQLAAFEANGMRLGLAVVIPDDRWIVQVTMLDAAGGILVIDTIEQTGALPSVTIN